MTPDPAKGQAAVIDIGSSAIRLVIADIKAPGRWTVIESANRPTPLGRDVFLNGKIGRETMRQSLLILQSFREIIDTYGIQTIRAIGTSAVREAENMDIFLDRVLLRTRIPVNVIEGIEANYLTYMAVRSALKDANLKFDRSDSLIMEVGSGSTEMMILQGGKMASAHTLRIGAARVEGHVTPDVGSSAHRTKMFRERVLNALDILQSEAPLTSISLFVAVGGDARMAAKCIGKEKEDGYAVIREKEFRQFAGELTNLSIEEIVRRYHVPYDEAEILAPALVIYSMFAEATAATRLIVPHVSIRDGVLLDLSLASSEDYRRDIHNQVIASTLMLCRRFHAAEAHSRHVADVALRLFDELQDEHGLGPKERTFLEVAGLLHDVGIFINFSSHHKHGEYIVSASEIFGLNRNDLQIVAQVVRYHRRALPSPAHSNYMALSRQDRIVVSKLAALLRVADAMDRGHQARIFDFDVEKTDQELVLRCKDAGDISLEQLGIDYKADMFEEVFGLKVVLL